MSAATVAAIVLAAGDASRYGAPKQLLPIEGVPMVRRIALAALGAATRVVVVTGARRAQVEAALHGLDVACTFNASWRKGMGGSIAHGIGHVGRSMPVASACIVMLADQPQITAADLARIVAAAEAAPKHIIAARYGGVTGAPCLFPREYFEELISLSGDRGARVLIRRHADCVEELAVPHAALDIDTADDYLRYLRAPAVDPQTGMPNCESARNATEL